MTTVTITTASDTISSVNPVRMTLRTVDNVHVLNFPIAPREVIYENFGWIWEEIDRDGRSPYLVRTGMRLPTIEFTANLVYSREPDKSVEPLMAVLRNMADSTMTLTVKYGGWFDARVWRMDDLSFKTLQRNPDTNAPTHVEADITLKLASDIKLTVGPVSGGKTTKKKTTKKKSSKTRYYKIKKGDTLYKLANKFYGDPGEWKYLAKINKIKNPKKLKVGKKIKY